MALVVGACRSDQPLPGPVTVEPSVITPNGDGQADVARISYEIGQPARVSITLQPEEGDVHVLRHQESRQPGSYEALFGGVIEGRMLPSGRYTVTVSAQPLDETASPASVVSWLEIQGADPAPPRVEGFSADRTAFTPNQDGIGDGVRISYRLDEAVADFRLWLEQADGTYVTDIVQETKTADDPTQPGAHSFRFDAGVEADAPPPPDGEYRIVAEVRDRLGRVARESLPLTIRDSGKPSVALKGDVVWSERILPLGATLTFTATVQNMGDSPIRSRGPEPGFVYDNADSYNQVASPAVLLLARDGAGRSTSQRVPVQSGGVITTSLDLASGPETLEPRESAARLGASDGEADLPATVRVCGQVVDDGRPVVGAQVYAFEADGDNGIGTTSDAEGRFCFEALDLPPPMERNYAQSSGAMRLGVKYDDARQTLDYPYRWQLGRTTELDVCETEDRLYLCLPPGRQVQVTGGIRFSEPPYRRQTAIYTTIVHEDVRVIQPGYGRQQLLVEH